MESKEDDLRNRLGALKKRFQIINKGGEDCDGYISGQEEAYFIVNVLGEMPGIFEKEQILQDKIDEA